MNGFDPKSSKVNGQYQQLNQPEKADDIREVNIGDKKASVSKPKKWLLRLISVLFSPSKWGRASKPKANTASPIRHTPTPENQPAKAPGKPIMERTVSPVEDSDIASFINRPLPTPPEEESELPPAPPPRSKPQPAPQSRPRAQKPQTQTTSPADMSPPNSLKEFAEHFTEGHYIVSDSNIDKNAVKQHLRDLTKDQLRPDNRNVEYKRLPADAKTLVQEVYAEKKVEEELNKLPTGSSQELEVLRNKLGTLYKNPTTRQPTQTSQILVQEFDRQQLKAKFSAAYQAKPNIPRELQENFPDDRQLRENLTEENRQILKDYALLKTDAQEITDSLTARADESPRFKSEAVPKYKDIPCDKKSCAANPNHLYHCNTVETPSGNYVAAQGCVEETEANFISMLVHQKSGVSVSLVSKGELDAKRIEPDRQKGIKSNLNKRTISAGPRTLGEEKTYNDVKVKLENQFWLDNGNVRVDVLKLNGEQHFRVYDTGWEDHTSGNPSRLAALSVLVEQLRQDPSVADRRDNPTVVNCNAGVGRTGTFITLDNSTREYLNSGQVNTNIDGVILKARETRKAFVQTAGQYNALKELHKNLPAVLDPLISAARLEIKNTPEPSDTITEIDETYANFEAVYPQSQTSSRKPRIVSTAKQFIQRFDSDYYGNQPDYWEAVQQDISTIYDTVELGILTNNISEFAKHNQEYREQANYMESLVNAQRKIVSGQGSAVDNVHRQAIQTRNR